jgi:hypothetical protein
MSRRTRERRLEAHERWPLLTNLIGCYFNQDYALLYGSLAGALTAAARDGSLDHRRALLKEWRDWNGTEGAMNDIRPFLYDGFGVDVLLKLPIDGRNLMNRLYDEILAVVKQETETPP